MLRIKDEHTLEVLRGVVLAFFLRALGAGLAFAFNVAIGRLLGAEGTGLYFLALSVVTIGAVFAKLGLDNTLLRFIASGAATNNANQVKGVFSLAMKLALTSCLALTLAVFIFAPLISLHIFNKPALVTTLRIMSAGLFTFAAMTLLAESLKGLKRIRNSMLVSGVIYPSVALILIWPLTRLWGVQGAALAYVGGTATAALIGYIFWKRNTKSFTAPSPSFDKSTLLDSSRPLWVMSVINKAIIPWLPLFLLGIWGSTQDAGIFGIATRISLLISFFLTAVNTIMAPKFAELYERKDMESLARITRRFALLITLAASPLFALLIFKGEWVMSFFGPEFARGSLALSILAIGQAVKTATGSVGYLLIMTGHERDVRNASIFSMILMSILALLVMPTYGLVGAAITSAVTLACTNIYTLVLVRIRLGINALPIGRM